VLDPAQTSGLYVEGTGGALVPYDAPDRLDGLWQSKQAATRRRGTLQRGARVAVRRRRDLRRGRPGRRDARDGHDGDPSDASLRLDLSTTFAELVRDREGSEFARTVLARAKFEYQPTRALFSAGRRVPRRAGGRPAGCRHGRAARRCSGVPVAATRSRALRVDWLVSYEPSPGTVAYFGYGALFDPPVESQWSSLERANDGFFVKIAYLFRR